VHVGPYEEFGKTCEQLDAFARSQHFVLICAAHDTYVSDPRMSAPERRRTVVHLSIGR
jgi:hypothetical protein